MNPLLRSFVVAAGCAVLLSTGCATSAVKASARPQPGQRVLVVFKITYQDRAGESGTAIRKTGEIVTIERGQAVIEGDEGDILRCPVNALHELQQRAEATNGVAIPAPPLQK